MHELGAVYHASRLCALPAVPEPTGGASTRHPSMTPARVAVRVAPALARGPCMADAPRSTHAESVSPIQMPAG